MRCGGVLVRSQELHSGGTHSEPRIGSLRNSQAMRATEAHPESVSLSDKGRAEGFPSTGSRKAMHRSQASGICCLRAEISRGGEKGYGLPDPSLQDIAHPWPLKALLQVPSLPRLC